MRAGEVLGSAGRLHLAAARRTPESQDENTLPDRMSKGTRPEDHTNLTIGVQAGQATVSPAEASRHCGRPSEADGA